MSPRRTILALAILIPFCVTAPAQDDLEPETGILNEAAFHWKYAKKLRGKLLKGASPYYQARLICLPSFEPEWVVTVTHEDPGLLTPDQEVTSFVECAVAGENLWYAKKWRKVAVTKARVDLDRETAKAVHDVWKRMLRRVHYPTAVETGTDGVTYHFSRFVVPAFDRRLFDESGGHEQGKVWSPESDSLTGGLVTIGEALKRYALAAPEEQEKRRLDIRSKVDQLKIKLDKLP